MDSATLDDLQTEVDFYRHNQTEFEQEIRTLIADNQKLAQQVTMLFKEKLENGRLAQNSNEEQTKQLTDLSQQVTLLASERDSLHMLWKTSQATIDALEKELKAYQSDDGNKNLTEENKDLELKLEAAISDYVHLESKYKDLQKQHADLKNELTNKEKQIECYKERGKELQDKLNEVNNDLNQYRTHLEIERKNSEDRKCQITLRQQEILEIVKKEVEAKSKVAEALQLYDAVSSQKVEACKTIQELTAQLTEYKTTLSRIKNDIEISCRREIDELKEKYNEKVADMLEHLKTLDSELIDKGKLLNKTIRENKVLREANENFLEQHKENMKAVDPKLAIAEQRLEAMLQELILSERRNIQLVCEKQCLVSDIQRLQDVHEREIKRRDWEEKLLKTQSNELKMQVEHLQTSLEETHEMVNKLQNIISSRAELNQKMVSTKEKELSELNKHLENQIELSKKWKKSYLDMVEKLKKRLVDLQKENQMLRAKLTGSVGSSIDDNSTIS